VPRRIQPERAIKVLKAHSKDGEHYIFVLKFHGIFINSMRFNTRTNQVLWPKGKSSRYPLIRAHTGTTRHVQHAMWIYIASRMLEELPSGLSLAEKVRTVQKRYPDLEYDPERGFYFPHWSVLKQKEEAINFQSHLQEFHRQIWDRENIAHRVTGWLHRDPNADLEVLHRDFVKNRCDHFRKWIGNEADFDKVFPRSKAVLDRIKLELMVDASAQTLAKKVSNEARSSHIAAA